ncbi:MULTISPECIES: hypothetical protein [unclassified Acinetobacter]|uniref:hypothetical protein n=1 Tax=unclassified Acinetobacter TaxID=196816 RepID=UPI003A8855F7
MPYKRIELFEKKQFGETPLKVDAYYIYYGDDMNTGGYTASLAYKPAGCAYQGRYRTLSNISADEALSEMLDNIRSAYNLNEYVENLSDWNQL